jgi:hypothetical protein
MLPQCNQSSGAFTANQVEIIAWFWVSCVDLVSNIVHNLPQSLSEDNPLTLLHRDSRDRMRNLGNRNQYIVNRVGNAGRGLP